MSALQTLMEMGFSENASKKALAVTGGGGVEQAMEWLLAHADDPAINDPPAQAEAGKTAAQAEAGKTEDSNQEKMEVECAADKASEEKKEGEADKASEEKKEGEADKASEEKKEEEEEPKANSIRCDDCGKVFSTSEEVEYHAVKSGHENFSESSDEIKPLTEEEKIQKKKDLEDKIKLRRKEREEKEEEETRERERKRVQMGQAMAERKRLMQEKEIMKAVEERKRDKMEDKLARQKVKEQIERDRQARKEMFSNNQDTPKPTAQVQPFVNVQPTQKKEYTTARLQMRLPTGSPLVQEFKAKEALSAVRLWISLNRQDGQPSDTPIKLSMTFPRKTFSEEDMDKPLDLLGLVPSAVLMVTQ